jgi:CheY-like chemotaxis protein
MLELLKVSISKNVVLQRDLRANLPAVWANASQIRQVVMNLVINASEAIGDKEGVITVRTSQVSGGRDLAMDLTPGDYVKLEVSDTGSGITEGDQQKLFDPFFTTKFAGRGLGLAVVQGIVRTHGGGINVVSAPGEGTVFQVFLPCALQPASPPLTKSGELAGINVRPGTILVVEDEEALRRAISQLLRKRGFSVLEAQDGSVALGLIRAHIDEIDAVLLDFTLPGMSSREVFQETLRVRPGVPVIVTSAYGIETITASFVELQVDHFIRKPFALEDLLRLLDSVLSPGQRARVARPRAGPSVESKDRKDT